MFLRFATIILFTWLIFSCKAQDNHHNVSRKTIKVRKDIPFFLLLPSNLAQGYQWQLYDTTTIKVLDHFSKDNPNKTESQDLEELKLKATKKGKVSITLYYIRPFDPTQDTTKAKKIMQSIKVL